jgi:SulP family sulfate permease
MENKSPTAWSLRAYGLHTFRRDLIAGLTVATVAVPQAMAYALIAGIEPLYGIYTAVVMTALASLFGSSAHLINGPTNAISLVVFGAVAGLPGAEDPLRAIQLVGLLGILVGLIQIVIALLKLGDLTRYVSESVILGFMAGAGFLVAVTQLPDLLGLEKRGDAHDHLLVRLWLTFTRGGSVNFSSLAIGLTTVALVFGLHRLNAWLKIKLPELLLTLIVISLAVGLLGLAPADKSIHLERRLPAFQLPLLDPEVIRQLCGGALAIALLGLVEAVAIAKSLAARTRQPLDYNRQCMAEGLANLGGGLFQCMPGSGSLTRSVINYFAGAVTRLSGIYSALAVAATLLLFAPLAQFIPRPALAGVLLWTAGRIVDRYRLLYCLRATRFDAGMVLATAACAVFVSIEFSILIGTILSFLLFVPRVAKIHASELVLSPERTVRERQPSDPQCTKLVVYSFEGDFFFGAAPELDEHLAAVTRRVEQGARVVVLGLKHARNPDMVCMEHLHRFLADMHRRQVPVLLCGVRDDFARALHNLRQHHALPPEYVFREDGKTGSSTLEAVRRAYELLGNDLCPTCPRRQDREADKGPWYYMI